MRVLIFLENHFRNLIGSAEIQAHLMTEFLMENGHDVIYACETNHVIKLNQYINR